MILCGCVVPTVGHGVRTTRLGGVEWVKAGEDASGCGDDAFGGVGHEVGFFAGGRPVADVGE
jgi:hypothetical protein